MQVAPDLWTNFVDNPLVERMFDLACWTARRVEARDGRQRAPGPRETGASSSLGEWAVTDLDNLRRSADIRRGLEMNPDRDDFIVEGLYAHFVAVHERQPEGDEFPEYVHLISSTHEWGELWELFSPGSPLTEEEKAARLRRVMPLMTVGPADGRRRRPGRPKGTRSATRDQLIEAFRTYRATHRRRPTQVQLAANLKPPIAVRTLQDLLAEYGLPWPLE